MEQMAVKASKRRDSGIYGSGEITVFLSLILTCICALMSALLESARVAGSGWYLQMASNSSIDSLMSQYHRELWEKYHLLLLEFEDVEGLESEMEPYLNAYMEAEPFYGLEKGQIKIKQPVRVTDQGGAPLEKEIVDYMKLGVLSIETDPSMWEERRSQIKESDSLGDLTDKSQVDMRKLLKLEKAADAVTDSLRRQQELLDEGARLLQSCNGKGFIRSAEKLKKELKKMPSLVEKYEKEADELKEELRKSDILAMQKKEDMQEETWKLFSEEMDGLHAYTDQEGERRKEVVEAGERAGTNLDIVEAAIEEAEDTLDYIDSWESDDDDDELDERPLWRAVLHTWLRFHKTSSLREPAIKDKKKMTLLESISKLAGGDLLSLVVPDDKSVSGYAVFTSNYPSLTESKSDFQGTGNGLSEIMEIVLINEYVCRHFTNFLSEEENAFRYEQEYILNGKDSDRANLKAMVNRLVKIREALNLICLLKDSEKRREVNAMALTITGAASITPLTYVTAFFIMSVWAFAEALEDVRTLLGDGNVPLLKDPDSWKTSLNTLLSSGNAKEALSSGSAKIEGDSGSSGQPGEGLSYQEYIKLFLLMQDRVNKDYRMMDMIQENICEDQKGFMIRQCAYRLEADCESKGKRGSIKRHTAKEY